MLTAEVLALTTRVDRHDHQPGFVEIDLVGHEGGDNNGDFASSPTVTDIATGWTDPQRPEQSGPARVRRLGGDPGRLAVPAAGHRL
jgi:hypothetical protein